MSWLCLSLCTWHESFGPGLRSSFLARRRARLSTASGYLAPELPHYKWLRRRGAADGFLDIVATTGSKQIRKAPKRSIQVQSSFIPQKASSGNSTTIETPLRPKLCYIEEAVNKAATRGRLLKPRITPATFVQAQPATKELRFHPVHCPPLLFLWPLLLFFLCLWLRVLGGRMSW